MSVTPARNERRAGWSEAAAAVSAERNDDEATWQGFGNEDDANLTW